MTLVSKIEAAEILNVNPTTVSRWVKSGRLHIVKEKGNYDYLDIAELKGISKIKSGAPRIRTIAESRELHNVRDNIRRWQYLVNKQCRQCGSKEVYSAKYCKRCYQSMKLRMTTKNKQLLRDGICRSCWKNPIVPNRTSCMKCLRIASARSVIYSWEGRIILLLAMGGKCTACGNSDLRVLEIDHVIPYHHRKNAFDWEIVSAAIKTSWVVRDAILELYKEGLLQLLCRNCNKLKEFNTSQTSFDTALNNIKLGDIPKRKFMPRTATGNITKALNIINNWRNSILQ